MNASRRYSSYSTFRAKARGKYTGRNRRRTRYRYRRRRTGKRLPFFRKSYKPRRVYRRLGVSKALGNRFLLHSQKENYHICYGLTPVASDPKTNGATAFTMLFSPWELFKFTDSIQDVVWIGPHVEGPGSPKINIQRYVSELRISPRFMFPNALGSNPTSYGITTMNAAATTDIGWSLRVIWFTWKDAVFENQEKFGDDATTIPVTSRAGYVMKVGTFPPGGDKAPYLFDWERFIGNPGSAYPMIDLTQSIRRNHPGVFKVVSDRTYRFSNTKDRVIKRYRRPWIEDLNVDWMAGQSKYLRTKDSCLLVFDVKYPTRLENPPIEDLEQNYPRLKFDVAASSKVVYSLIK